MVAARSVNIEGQSSHGKVLPSGRKNKSLNPVNDAKDCPGFILHPIFGYQNRCQNCMFSKVEHQSEKADTRVSENQVGRKAKFPTKKKTQQAKSFIQTPSVLLGNHSHDPFGPRVERKLPVEYWVSRKIE